MTNAERIAEIAARAKAATKGPWTTWTASRGNIRWKLVRIGETDVSVAEVPPSRHCARNAAFIAAARKDIPWLLARLRKATDWERLAKAAWNAIDDDRLNAQENVDAIADALKAAVEEEA